MKFLSAYLISIIFLFCHPASAIGQSVSTKDNKVWSKTPDGYKVSFLQEGVPTNIYYTDDGLWLATMRYLPLQLLPAEVKALTKKSYPGYSIFFAQDIRTETGLSWVSKIQNPIGWKTLGIREGEIVVKESFEKN